MNKLIPLAAITALMAGPAFAQDAKTPAGTTAAKPVVTAPATTTQVAPKVEAGKPAVDAGKMNVGAPKPADTMKPAVQSTPATTVPSTTVAPTTVAPKADAAKGSTSAQPASATGAPKVDAGKTAAPVVMQPKADAGQTAAPAAGTAPVGEVKKQ